MGFAQYIYKNQKKLRCGYTTGTCAAIAAKAAAQALLNGSWGKTASIVTPRGVVVEADILEPLLERGFASCAVRKDSGDDPDITNGMLVYARAEKSEEPGITIDGGEGIGRVTRNGLDQPIGAAAINRVPRQMIEKEVAAVCISSGYDEGLKVIISIPGGDEIAKKTFNPRLGIEGGLSVLGTSGIVEPMSEQAFVDSIRLELSRIQADGGRSAVITPGNYGEDYLKNELQGLELFTVKCSNFVGETLDNAVSLGFERVLLVGHIGKLIKLAGGIMNTHSNYADARMELMGVHAALHGADRELVKALVDCGTTDEGLGLLQKEGLMEAVMSSLMEKIHFHIKKRVGAGVWIEALLFSNIYGRLGETEGFSRLLARMTEVNP